MTPDRDENSDTNLKEFRQPKNIFIASNLQKIAFQVKILFAYRGVVIGPDPGCTAHSPLRFLPHKNKALSPESSQIAAAC